MQLPPTILSIGNNKKAKAKAKDFASISTNKSSRSKKEATVKAEPEEPVENDSGSGTDEDKSEEEQESDVEGEEAQTPEPLPSKLKPLTTRRIELIPPRTLETTLFDRLEKMYGPSIKRMLKVQYRFVFVPLFHPLLTPLIECTLRSAPSRRRPCMVLDFNPTPPLPHAFCKTYPTHMPIQRKT